MISKNFILSEKKTDRIKRHLLFWACWWLYFGFVHAANPMGKPEIYYFGNLPFTISESLLMLIPQTLLAYPLLYFVLPSFIFKSEYYKAFLWTLLFLFLSLVANIIMIKYVNPKILSFILSDYFLTDSQRPPAASLSLAIFSSLKGALTGAALAVGIKLLKHWYVKDNRNLELQKEKSEAQLQLLTAQVHPHFLFNTLNNIYSQTQNESPKGSKMIMALSDLLRYIVSEGNKTLVPLDKELTMLNDYINLEKIRYGNDLNLYISMPEETGSLQITPLLLLPFVENCFKHGASKFLIQPWINLKIELKETTLIMKLMNGKDSHHSEPLIKSGTGITNVKKRLELLYKDKYELQIIDEPEVFVVNLKLELTEANPVSKEINESIPALNYA